MADIWTVSGWIMTAGFGGLSVFQFVKDIIRRKVWDERARGLMGVKAGLMQLRAMLTEAGTTGEIVRNDATKQFVRQIGHQVLGIEHHIDLMLQGDGVKMVESTMTETPIRK